MCGVVGIVSRSAVNQQIYDALLALQHRGQDSAGIVTWEEGRAATDGRLQLRKGNGLVREVFEERHMRRLRGNMGIGHVRYPTAGTASAAEAQPMYVNAPYGISLAHNGNLTNAAELEAGVFRAGLLEEVLCDTDEDLARDVLPRLAGRAVGWHIDGFHYDIGTPEDLALVRRRVAAGEIA